MIYTVGIEADLKMVERLTFIQEDLGKIAASRGAESRWTRPEHLFIPLVYLGMRDEGVVPEINSVLDECASRVQRFRISVAGIRVWPGASVPRLITIGVDNGRDRVISLRDEICASLAEINLGFDDREFVPQMLLGRIVTTGEPVDLGDAINAIKDLNFGGTDIFEIVLYGSELTVSGTAHHVVSRFFLRG